MWIMAISILHSLFNDKNSCKPDLSWNEIDFMGLFRGCEVPLAVVGFYSVWRFKRGGKWVIFVH